MRDLLKLMSVFLFSVSMHAQWTPLLAQVTEVQYREDARGVKLILEESRGSYARASDGSFRITLQKLERSKQLNIGEAVIASVASHQIVRLNYNANVYKVIGDLPLRYLPRTRSNPPPGAIKGEQTINGVLCKGLAVKGSEVAEGIAWFSFKNDLKVKEVTVFKSGVHYLYDLTNIQIETEPEKALFDIPAGFVRQ